jgi:hypothetical protein
MNEIDAVLLSLKDPDMSDDNSFCYLPGRIYKKNNITATEKIGKTQPHRTIIRRRKLLKQSLSIGYHS